MVFAYFGCAIGDSGVKWIDAQLSATHAHSPPPFIKTRPQPAVRLLAVRNQREGSPAGKPADASTGRSRITREPPPAAGIQTQHHSTPTSAESSTSRSGQCYTSQPRCTRWVWSIKMAIPFAHGEAVQSRIHNQACTPELPPLLLADITIRHGALLIIVRAERYDGSGLNGIATPRGRTPTRPGSE